MPDFICKNIVLCDEVRQEKTEKYLLLGVYSSGITLQQVPAQISLSLYVELIFPSAGDYSVAIKTKLAENNSLVTVEVNIVDPTVPMAIPTPRIPLVITDAGELVVSVGSSTDDLVETARFRVNVNPQVWSMFPTASEPPSEQ
jgi:hypothetical protein